jgi:prepilin peptidase CpaA
MMATIAEQQTHAGLTGSNSPVWSEVISLGVAAFAVAALVWIPGKETPLPALGWAAAFLFLAVHQDVRRMRIPNWLTFPALLLAVGLGALDAGVSGLLSALAGAGIGLAVMFVPFAMRWLGAGDVKAGMVLGALWGGDVFLPVFWWMVVAGGVFAIAWVALQGGLWDLLCRWGRSAQATLLTRRLTYYGPASGSVTATGLPFAVAMAFGAAAFQIWGTPWS